MRALIVTVPSSLALNIVSGKKQVEFRKKLPLQTVGKLFVCEARSGGKIVAEAVIDKMTMLPPKCAWERFANRAGVSKAAFFLYVGDKLEIGCIEISAAKPMTGKYLNDFGISHAPQNFQYINL
jgi:predicted transcriptional regulator